MVKGFREQLDSDDEQNQQPIMYVLLTRKTIDHAISILALINQLNMNLHHHPLKL